MLQRRIIFTLLLFLISCGKDRERAHSEANLITKNNTSKILIVNELEISKNSEYLETVSINKTDSFKVSLGYNNDLKLNDNYTVSFDAVKHPHFAKLRAVLINEQNEIISKEFEIINSLEEVRVEILPERHDLFFGKIKIFILESLTIQGEKNVNSLVKKESSCLEGRIELKDTINLDKICQNKRMKFFLEYKRTEPTFNSDRVKISYNLIGINFASKAYFYRSNHSGEKEVTINTNEIFDKIIEDKELGLFKEGELFELGNIDGKSLSIKNYIEERVYPSGIQSFRISGAKKKRKKLKRSEMLTYKKKVYKGKRTFSETKKFSCPVIVRLVGYIY